MTPMNNADASGSKISTVIWELIKTLKDTSDL